MIPNKFLCYLTEEAFNKEIGNINPTSIVVVIDKGFIYTHGAYFYCGFSPNVQKTLSEALTNLNNVVEESNLTISKALCDIKSNMVTRDEVDIDKINAQLAESKQSIIADVTALGDSLKSEVEGISNQAIETVEEIVEDTENVEKISSKSLTELYEEVMSTNKTLGYIINDLKSQITTLKDKIG
jgi:hypothetical protein